MPRADDHSHWVGGRDELGESKGCVGVAKLGLISLKGLGLIVAVVLAVAWLSESEPHQDYPRGRILPGEPGRREPLSRSLRTVRE